MRKTPKGKPEWLYDVDAPISTGQDRTGQWWGIVRRTDPNIIRLFGPFESEKEAELHTFRFLFADVMPARKLTIASCGHIVSAIPSEVPLPCDTCLLLDTVE